MRIKALFKFINLTLVALMMASPLSAIAQSQAVAGSIEGTVTDANGAVVPDAKVTATSLETGLKREATTNSEGIYRLLSLPVGQYDVTIEKQGFATVKHQAVKVQIGQKLTLDAELGAAGASETINVTAEAPIVETTRTQVSAIVNDKAVSNLPTNGRNFIDFVLLTPGVTRDVRTGDISFAGQRGTLNSLQIDGADNNNTFFGQSLGRTGSGRAPYQFSQDAVQEFQVNSNGYSAEFGRAAGAVVNVVTKSGTNQFHGTLFDFYRDKSLNANNFFNNATKRPRPALHVHQFGGNIGGPIKKDKLFFFFDFDGQRRQDPVDVILQGTLVGPADPNFAAQQRALAEIAPRIGGYPRSFNQDVYLAKVDWQLSNANRLSGRYNHQKFIGGSLENSAPTGIPNTTSTFEHTGNSNVKTDTLTVSLSSILTPHLLNEARFNYGRDSEPGTANSDDPEVVILQGGVTAVQLGRNNFSPRETTLRRYQFIDNVSYTLGKHALKTGVDVNIENILNFFPGLFGGQYTFNSLADFANRRPARFVQAFAGQGTSGPTTHPNNREFAAFLQDDWRASQRLTLNLGLRYDIQKMAEPEIKNPDAQLAAAGIDTSFVKTDKNNFAPRVGFAWNPLESNKLVVRGGYGIFFGRTPAIMLGTAHSQNGIQVINLTFTGSAMPTFPNRFASLPTGVTLPPTNIYVFARDYVSPYTEQWSLGAEYELVKDLSVNFTYLGVKGTHLSRTRDINLLPPVVATIRDDGGRTFSYLRFPGRLYSHFARISQFESNGNSIYNGFTAQVTKRFSRSFQLLGAFTFSRAIDDNPDATSVVPGNAGDDSKMIQNPLDIADDRALSVNQVRRRLVISGIWAVGDYARNIENHALRAVLSGWSFSGIITAEDGRPYTAKVGNDLNNDGNRFTDRVPGFGRNTFIGPGFFSVDPRLTRDITLHERVRLQLIAEAFNAFNRPNFTNVNTTFYNLVGTFPNNSLVAIRNFGQPTATTDPRIIQLAAKIIF
ncbi:MAG TPA: TonB-dependent receptor [Blastocatellia bacterium]|nr:TonB-dependent receptor [Blastocatellia bacterium]